MLKLFKSYCTGFTFLFLLSNAYGQTVIKGQVVEDQSKIPLPGVSVKADSSLIGTQTDRDGYFSLIIPDALYSKPLFLELHHVGYHSAKVEVSKKNSALIQIVLKADTLDLTNVVTVGYGTVKKRPSKMPEFPWPPPPCSGRIIFNNSLFTRVKTLQEIDHLLIDALENSRYFDYAHFYIPRGFALATKIEQIDEAGISLEEPGRWSPTISPKKLNFEEYIKALFFPTPGYFRIIVFIVTDLPYAYSDIKATRKQANAWIESGWSILPEEFSKMKFSKNYYCSALVYEFIKPEAREAYFNIPGRFDAYEHLQKSGLLNFIKAQ